MTSLYDAELGADAVVRRSASGLLRRVRHGDTSLVVDASDEVGLVLNLSGSHRVDRRMAGLTSSEVPAVGSVSIMPPGCPTWITITGECRVLQLRLPWPEMTRGVAEEHGLDPTHAELRPRLNATDPVLARLLYAAAVTEQEGTEEATGTIVSHLIAKHAARTRIAPAKPSSGGIPPARLRRALDRIEAELHGAVTLSTLAGDAGMSRFHFAREFVRMTGLAPHQFLLRRRVDRAILLLACPALTVAEVARGAGFAHASHLARHMHRLTGVTPQAFRTQVLP